MKIVILAGGLGSRLSEETITLPKPMLKIGDKPILWHIMKIYFEFGFNEFIILLGYKGYVIKEYFSNYLLHACNFTIDISKNQLEIHNNSTENWRVTMLETGASSMTGGRIIQAKPYINNQTFMLTYGDAVADINIKDLLANHKIHGKALTMTTVQPEGRFGIVDTDQKGQIRSFTEKPKGDGAWINGGFFVCEPKVFDYINEGDSTIWEKSPLENLAKDGELFAYKHNGFWKCMDTLRDKTQLNELWNDKRAEWKIWN